MLKPKVTLKKTAVGGAHVVVNKPSGETWISNTRPVERAATEYWRIRKAIAKKGGTNGHA